MKRLKGTPIVFYLESGNEQLPKLWRETECEGLPEKKMADDLWKIENIHLAAAALQSL